MQPGDLTLEGNEQIDLRDTIDLGRVDHRQRETTPAPGATTAAHAATSPGADSASSTVGGRVDGSNIHMILLVRQYGCLGRFPCNIREIGGNAETRTGTGRETNEPRAEGGEVETRADGETRKDASRQRKRGQRAEPRAERRPGNRQRKPSKQRLSRRRAVQIPKRNGTRQRKPGTQTENERQGAKERRGTVDAAKGRRPGSGGRARRSPPSRGLKPSAYDPAAKRRSSQFPSRCQRCATGAASVVRQRLPSHRRIR